MQDNDRRFGALVATADKALKCSELIKDPKNLTDEQVAFVIDSIQAFFRG